MEGMHTLLTYLFNSRSVQVDFQFLLLNCCDLVLFSTYNLYENSYHCIEKFIRKYVTCEKLLLIYDLLTKSRSIFVRIILGLISKIILMYMYLGLRGCFSAFKIIYLFFKTMFL
ncbi:hypothetical protein HanLR1_Chr11g0416791 [Helianthus annuus]|nr:hypothetical protein HanLR1_Chr11g0416791 [Helianthus annuus]